MRHFLFSILILLGLGTAAIAQGIEGLSDRIASDGIADTLDALDAEPAPDASTRFAIGGLRFLRGVERALQTRWRHGMDGPSNAPIPVLRLPLPRNPQPEEFRPELVDEIFAALVADMAAAREPLLTVGDTDAVGGAVLQRPRRGPQGDAIPPTVRFDTADAAWLAAYTHLLASVGEFVQAFDSATAIAEVRRASGELQALRALGEPTNAFSEMFSSEADLALMIYRAIQGQPDPQHTRAARDHLLAMVRQNRDFWTRVGAETDNTSEWIPNARQTSALGIELPADTEAVWLGVLDDAEALLLGEKLIPHWRMGGGAGINLYKLLEDPVPVDIAEWLHGMGLLRFAEPGERISSENWRRFERMARGEAMTFIVFLN